MSKKAVDIAALPVDERLALIDEIWASLESRPSKVPVSASDRVELDRRLEDIRTGDDAGIPWHEVLEKVRARIA